MKENILFNTINDIQNEYLQFLRNFKKAPIENYYLIIDCLQSFWFAKKNIIESFLNHYSNNYDTCVFLCGSYINTYNYSHLPFNGLGKKHILDDVVVKFSIVSLQDPSKEIVNIAASSLKKAIDDNINCLEKYPEIIILPISFLFDDIEMIRHGADSAFFSLFNTSNLTIEKYLEKYSTLGEVFNDLKDYVKEQLYLDNHPDLPLDKRYSTYLSETGFSKPSDNEVLNFYALTSSLYAQALSIIALCIRFQLYPYIREKVIFHNFMLLIDNFSPYVDSRIKLSALIHFLFLNIIDCEYDNYESSKDDLKKVSNQNILDDIRLEIEKCKIRINSTGSFRKIQNIIYSKLKCLGITFIE